MERGEWGGGGLDGVRYNHMIHDTVMSDVTEGPFCRYLFIKSEMKQ